MGTVQCCQLSVPCKRKVVTNSELEIFTKTRTNEKRTRLRKKGSYFEEFSKYVRTNRGSILSTYEIDERLGEGAYGAVFKAKDRKTRKNVAVKYLKRDKLNFAAFENEISILKKLDHPNIIRVSECFVEPNCIYIVQEYASGGDLYQFVKQQQHLSEKKASEVMSQLLNALVHLHANRIVHRDIKPENIVFEKTKDGSIFIKLIDFGTSIKFTDKALTRELGTVYA